MKQNFERAFMGALVMTLPGLLIARWLASGAFGLVVITMFFITLGSFLAVLRVRPFRWLEKKLGL